MTTPAIEALQAEYDRLCLVSEEAEAAAVASRDAWTTATKLRDFANFKLIKAMSREVNRQKKAKP